MKSEISLSELRELFISAPESDTTRLLAMVFSVAIVAVVLWLIRRRVLREEYTPIWIGAALCLLVVSIWAEGLEVITRAIGAWSMSSAIFFLGELFLFLICLNYAVRLSQTSLRLKNMAQEMALLRARLERLEPSTSE